MGKKKQIKRFCVVCNKTKRTTNTEMNPYVCEVCLRKQAPKWMEISKKAKIAVAERMEKSENKTSFWKKLKKFMFGG